MQEESGNGLKVSGLKDRVDALEKRINRLEETFSKFNDSGRYVDTHQNYSEADIDISFPFKPKVSIESGMGEYGMAWLGNIILLIAVVFIVEHLHSSGNSLLSVITGYAAVFGIYAISFFTRKTYDYLSSLFKYGGHLLLFYITLRLHFVENPVVGNLSTGLAALLMVLVVLFYSAWKEKSQLFAGTVLLMALTAGVISNSTHFLLGISTLTAVITMILYQRFGWINLVIAFIFFTYFVQFIWLLNNPVITQETRFREKHEFCYIYFIAIGFIFSLLAILPKKEKVSNEVLIFALIWNGLGFTLLLILTVFTFLEDNYVLMFGLISLFCLFYSVVIHSRSFLKIGASFYAVYGFVTMSVAIYGIFLLPGAYTLLAVQSLLVVSVALWFRSRFLVVINTLLFLILLILYLVNPLSQGSTNFSFMLVAFVTARVINWKKDRLNLKTELVRNLYLFSGFVMTLFALHHAMPDSLVIVSWIFSAVVFLLLSHLLKNMKYRWLAIAALVASAIHLLVVDISHMDTGLRILVFLLFAVISIAVSVIYTKYLIKKKES